MINVYINVSPSAAVRAGSAKSGTIRIQLEQNQIDQLTPEQRETLAECLQINSEKSPIYDIPSAKFEDLQTFLSNKHKQKIEKIAREKEFITKRSAFIVDYAKLLTDTPAEEIVAQKVWDQWELKTPCFPIHTLNTYGTPQQALESEIKRLNEQLAQAENSPESHQLISNQLTILHQAIDKKQQAIHRAEKLIEQEAQKKEAEEKETQRKCLEAQRVLEEAKATWIDTHGTKSQKERFQAGVLPEAELWNFIRNQLFEPLDKFPKYKKMTFNRIVKELGECAHPDTPSEPNDIRFDHEPCKEFSPDQWEQLKKMQNALDNNPHFSFFMRRNLVFPTYGDEFTSIYETYSVRVEINWHGKELSRVYQMCD